MEIQEIEKTLYTLCKENKYEQAQRQLYSKHAISIEPPQSQGQQVTKGLENIIKKGDQFQAMVQEFHDGWVKEPKVHGNYISMEMGMDITMKGAGRTKMDEIALYHVQGGKIVSEQFFF